MFLAGAMAAPAAVALPAFALAAETFGHPELEAALIGASRELDDADNAEYQAQQRMSAWLAEHPRPELDDVGGGDGRKIKAAYDAYHIEMGKWQLARVTAWREIGVVNAQRSLRLATKKRDDAALAVANVVVTTMAGLHWKARLWLYDREDNVIAGSIAGDLLDMAEKNPNA
jgi:hypothetical protein